MQAILRRLGIAASPSLQHACCEPYMPSASDVPFQRRSHDEHHVHVPSCRDLEHLM